MDAAAAPLIDPEHLRAYMQRETRFWGRSVRQRREDLAMTLAQVAALAGTSIQTISKIEAGEIAARDHLRIALAFALSTEVDRLFPMPTREVIRREIEAAAETALVAS